jgi:AraC-like DNA-binding protein
MNCENAHYRYAEDIGGLEYLKASFVHQNFSRHVHEGICIGVVENGAQKFYRSGGQHIAPQDSIILVNADQVHTGQTATEQGWSYQAMYPLPEQLGDINRQMDGCNNATPYFPDPVVCDPDVAHMLRQLFSVLENSDNTLERQSWFMASMSMLIQRHSKGRIVLPPIRSAPLMVDILKQYLMDNCHKNVSLEELSQLVNLNPQYLVRLFRKYVGMPPHAWQIQKRVHRAKRLLLQGLSVAGVALDCGFTDQSHMNRYFKRFCGITPGRFARFRAY